MTVKVTEASISLKTRPNNMLWGLVGKTEDYDEFILQPDDVSVMQHTLDDDVLVYFPDTDFCYWLARGEYEVIKDS